MIMSSGKPSVRDVVFKIILGREDYNNTMISNRKNRVLSKSAGVTMVEIALVILIISILLAAVLGYREIIRISYLKKMATESQSFGIAARAFEQKYDFLPGDFPNASDMIAGCEAGNPNFCQDGDGDNNIGRYCHFGWSECYQTGSTIPGSDPNGGDAIPRRVPLETSMFWKHLYLSGMVGSIIIPTADPDRPIWGESHPKSAVEGAGYTVSAGTSFLGGYLWVNLLPTPESNPQGFNNAGDELGGTRALSVRDAMWLDNKYDNGGAGSGLMWWYPIGKTPAFEENGSLKSGTGNGCRRGDGGVENTWETHEMDRRNCVMNWSVY
jgi:hypothetical protein